MTAEQLAAFGAFLSGIAATVSAVLSSRWARRRAREQCDERLAAYKAGLHEFDADNRRD